MEARHGSSPLLSSEHYENIGPTYLATAIGRRTPTLSVRSLPVKAVDVGVVLRLPSGIRCFDVRRHICGPRHYHFTLGYLVYWLQELLRGTPTAFRTADIYAVKYHGAELPVARSGPPAGWEEDGFPYGSVAAKLWDPLRTVVGMDCHGELFGALDWWRYTSLCKPHP